MSVAYVDVFPETMGSKLKLALTEKELVNALNEFSDAQKLIDDEDNGIYNDEQVAEHKRKLEEKKHRNTIVAIRIIAFSLIISIAAVLGIVIKRYTFKYTEGRIEYAIHHVMSGIAVVVTLLNALKGIDLPHFQEVFYLDQI